MSALLRYQEECDRNAQRAERLEPMVWAVIRDLLDSPADSLVKRDFEEWLCDDPQPFIRPLLYRNDRTLTEVMDEAKDRYLAHLRQLFSWEEANANFRLCVEDDDE